MDFWDFGPVKSNAFFGRTNNLYQENNGKCDKGCKLNGSESELATFSNNPRRHPSASLASRQVLLRRLRQKL